VSALDPASVPRCIFVVENHPDTMKYLVMYLEDLGYITLQARNLEDAVAAWRDHPCDVLISDIGLPDGDGWDLMARLGADGNPPRFAIAMSGFGLNADEGKSRAAGYRYHLIKPFDPERLEEILDEAALENR